MLMQYWYVINSYTYFEHDTLINDNMILSCISVDGVGNKV